MRRDLSVYPSKSELIQSTVKILIESILRVTRTGTPYHLALAGGRTPRDIYALLAEERNRKQIEWNGVHLFWGDERMVPPNASDSNFRMVRESLLDRIEIPAANIHRMRGEMPPQTAASEYDELLRETFPSTPPMFDLVLLGLGEDGHTASLFPGTHVLAVTDQLAAAVYVPKLSAWRVTLTLPVLNNAREILFVVSGAGKAEIVKRIMAMNQPDPDLPATLVLPTRGRVKWLLDSDAAALLKNE